MTDPVKVGELLRAIDGYQGTPVVRAALALAPLVFLRPGELRLLDDPVLADLLVQRGLELERRHEPFLPEGGAYAAHHGHSHSHHPHVP